ncbi:hypothetical protein KSP9073_00876 [Kushneria phyllosphaerae]|uniref:Uncharacterized protein n=1 Tax=Kushneria phyllosphaerae TaxID=2100822 RepID=A0A2R8CJE8_9GAMM|nr:hypothetical protein KSP9073_00876 [Kushneria phyllosphaerae]
MHDSLKGGWLYNKFLYNNKEDRVWMTMIHY